MASARSPEVLSPRKKARALDSIRSIHPASATSMPAIRKYLYHFLTIGSFQRLLGSAASHVPTAAHPKESHRDQHRCGERNYEEDSRGQDDQLERPIEAPSRHEYKREACNE